MHGLLHDSQSLMGFFCVLPKVTLSLSRTSFGSSFPPLPSMSTRCVRATCTTLSVGDFSSSLMSLLSRHLCCRMKLFCSMRGVLIASQHMLSTVSWMWAALLDRVSGIDSLFLVVAATHGNRWLCCFLNIAPVVDWTFHKGGTTADFRLMALSYIEWCTDWHPAARLLVTGWQRWVQNNEVELQAARRQGVLPWSRWRWRIKCTHIWSKVQHGRTGVCTSTCEV